MLLNGEATALFYLLEKRKKKILVLIKLQIKIRSTSL